VVRDRYGGTILRVFVLSTIGRQRTIKINYYDEQKLFNVMSDVLYLATAWEGSQHAR
jgi:hypothetical protein